MTHVINVDLAKVWETKDRKGFIRTLTWGDAVEVEKITDAHVQIATHRFVAQDDGTVKPEKVSGFIAPTKSSGISPKEVVVEKAKDAVLRVNFVDVQQGDGCVIETAGGKVMLVDGGDNQLFARYLASRFRNTSEAVPKEIDCIVVTHGDADHFAGLTEIHKSEQHATKWKRLFIHPKRVYHNGLVKGPSTKNGKKVRDADLLGATKSVDGSTVIVGLEEDLLAVPDSRMNKPFLDWKKALAAFRKRGAITFRRLQRGDAEAFDFLADEKVTVDVLGPIPTQLNGKPGLRFLGTPVERLSIDPEENEPQFTGLSASHTINGHSCVLRLTYGGFRFLLAADLNAEAERDLITHHKASLQAEVLKVPHHGSADFSTKFVEAVAPVVSVVSSGDESERKEFIHPRANLMGALGRFSRLDKPLIFVTELVAFFKVLGLVTPTAKKAKDGEVAKKGGEKITTTKTAPVFAFQRTAFGMVKARTDGRRLLVCTDSGNVTMKEAYAFEHVGQAVRPVEVRDV